MKYLYLLFLILGPMACKTLDRASSRAQGLGSEGCDEASAPAEFRPLLRYLRAQLSVLVEANSRVLGSTEDFCFHITNDRDLKARATDSGVIVFSTGLLRATETDAQFAALLAHELAHVVKKHERMDGNEFVAKHPAYRSAYGELMRQLQEIPRFDILHELPERDWNEYLDHIRALALQKWLVHKREDKALAMSGLACAHIKTWEKISEARKAVLKKLPTADYEENLCQQFFQEFQLEEKLRRFLEQGKEKEADQLGIALFLNARYPEDEYAQFFANVIHLGGGQRACQRNEEQAGDCFRTESLRPEMKAYVKSLAERKPITIHRYPVSLVDLKRQFSFAPEEE